MGVAGKWEKLKHKNPLETMNVKNLSLSLSLT
jgi:hypothetical protein